MANRVSVEIDANVQGFVQGMDQATDSVKAYETETRKVSDYTENFRKELSAAKREVQNLELGYRKLTDAEKKSPFGREMRAQLDAAKKKAAEFIDIQKDLSKELSNMASDTRALDTFRDGFGLLGNSISSASGALALFTGNEEDARRAVVAFTTVQSTMNSLIGIGNALQKESNVMKAVSIIQDRARAASTALATTAIEGQTVATGAATVAQAAFNAVAEANPYVLLLSAVAAVTAAVWGYVAATNAADDEQEKLNKQLEEGTNAAKEYSKNVGNEFGKLMSKYAELRAAWNNLKTDHEKAQFLKERKKDFNELTDSVKDVKTAEDFLIKNSTNVVKSFQLRAQAAAQAALAIQKYTQAMQLAEESRGIGMRGTKLSIEAYKKLPDELKKQLIPIQKKVTAVVNQSITGAFTSETFETTGYRIPFDASIELLTALGKAGAYNQDMLKRSNALMEEGNKNIEKQIDLLAEASKLNTISNTSTSESKKKANAETKKVAKTLEEAISLYDAAAQKISDLQDKINSGTLDAKGIEKAKKEIDDYKKAMDALTNAWGIIGTSKALTFEGTIKAIKTAKDKINELQQDISNGLVDNNSIEEQKQQIQQLTDYVNTLISSIDFTNIVQQYDNLIKENEKLQKLVKDGRISPEMAEISQEQIKKNIEKIKALENLGIKAEIPVELVPGSSKALDKEIKKLKEELENLPIGSLAWIEKSKEIKTLEEKTAKAQKQQKIDDAMSGNFDKSINGYTDAIATLKTAMDDIDFEAMGLQGVAMWAMIQEALERYQETLKGMEKEQENQLMKPGEKVAKTFNKIGDVADMVGGSFKAMGDASKDAGMKSVGILSEALATLALSFAKALASTSTWVEWLAFGITGLTTFMTLGNAMKDAGKYASGGIIGGSSYSGDNIVAHVNSGEMLLNQRQQNNLFDWIDKDRLPGAGNSVVQVEGVIRGTDLLLVQKNTNKALSKAGNAITF